MNTLNKTSLAFFEDLHDVIYYNKKYIYDYEIDSIRND